MLFKSTLLLPALLALGLATAAPGPEFEDDLAARDTQIAVASHHGTKGSADASATSRHSFTTRMERFAVREIGSTTTTRTDAAEGETTISGVEGATKRLLSMLTDLRKQNGRWILQEDGYFNN
ncbi:hypothetical protein MKX08_005238 [Trichoderma sp. CBMAI-0020]|nr:hypothetical protein MKX08_005238 [Trichoderma sp. CBMAI-0020]